MREVMVINMPVNGNGNFSDLDRLTDALNSQKYTTSHYNEFACESATPDVRSCVMNILNEEHQIQQELFGEMSSRGWYPTESAEEQKLQNTKNQFSSCVACGCK